MRETFLDVLYYLCIPEICCNSMTNKSFSAFKTMLLNQVSIRTSIHLTISCIITYQRSINLRTKMRRRSCVWLDRVNRPRQRPTPTAVHMTEPPWLMCSSHHCTLVSFLVRHLPRKWLLWSPAVQTQQLLKLGKRSSGWKALADDTLLILKGKLQNKSTFMETPTSRQSVLPPWWHVCWLTLW